MQAPRDPHETGAEPTQSIVYWLRRRRPLEPREVEVVGDDVIEVQVRWGDALLEVAHLRRGESFALGDDGRRARAGAPVVVWRDGSFTFAAVPCDAAPEEIRGEVLYESRVGPLSVTARRVARAKRTARFGIPRDEGALGAGVAAAVLVGIGVASLYAATPLLEPELLEYDGLGDSALLARLTQRASGSAPVGGAAPNAGSPAAAPMHVHSTRCGVMSLCAGDRGARHAPATPERDEPRREITERGVFGALTGAGTIVSPFAGLEEALRVGDGARGTSGAENVPGIDGYDGLGPAGVGFGIGGGGLGTVVMGEINTIGAGNRGTGSGTGYGAGAGRALRGRATQGPYISAGTPEWTGALSPEHIRRVVLRNLGQIAHCHEEGLRVDPATAGRVSVRFIIGPDGAVMGAGITGSSVRAPSVGECVTNAVRRWQFPAPDGGGIVTVNYPFDLRAPE